MVDSTTYLCGWSKPGHEPDLDPAMIDGPEAARQFVIDALGEEHGGAYECAAAAVRLWGDAGGCTDEMPNGYTYWMRGR